MPRRSRLATRPCALACALALLLCGALSAPVAATAESSPPSWETTTDPIDPNFLLQLPFGKRSFWLQPWRAYMDTWPSSRLLESVGINFNVPLQDAEPVAQVLQESGFKLARISPSWNGISYDEPWKWTPAHETALLTRLQALKSHGLRPLFTLDANDQAPAPLKVVTLDTLRPAPAGATTVILSPQSAAAVVPGRTGFNYLTFGGMPDLLISSVGPGGVASLARPLPAPLPGGDHAGATLRFAPFQAPTLRDGRTNPAFLETMTGWLEYVNAVCKIGERVFGPGGYDVEMWNEITFGSAFLDYLYYGPTPRTDSGVDRRNEVLKAVIKALRWATVGFIRNPANGFSAGVGITDGFASETPFYSGAVAPPGETALSKHPYVGPRSYPEAFRPGAIVPVNALGVQDILPKSLPPYQPLFIPAFTSAMPEFMLTGINTETLIRDISPITTEIYGAPHGRFVGPPGQPPVQKWITEYNIEAPKEVSMTAADRVHFHAKALLRSLVSMVGKGFGREYFFGAAPGPFGLVSEGFYQALEEHPGTYPGTGQGGEVLDGFRNLLGRFQGPGPGSGARQLKLVSIAQYGDHAQFAGDGTAQHPSLYDREVLAVLPFQTAPNRFVIPVYVMTSDLATLYEPGAPAGNIHRYDLPDERFRITLANLPETGVVPTVSAYDPILDTSTPAQLIAHEGTTATIEVSATDSPRLIEIEL